MRSRRTCTRGFTVIELMVVIGIIAVLLGITFPALRSFRMEGYNVSCQSNLRQLGGIMQSYFNQNREVLPMVDFLPAATDEGPVGGLPWALRGYIKRDNECWCCPADHDEVDSRSTGTSYFYVPGLIRYTPSVQMQVQQALLSSMLDPTLSEDDIDRLREGMESRVVTGFFRQDATRMPILMDSVDRHPGTRNPRNALFFDSSVGIATDYEDVLGEGDGDDDDDDDGDDGG